ncbi:MAG: nucleotidyltransferase domain-containing protein [Candidatus Hydrothermales bacterium]
MIFNKNTNYNFPLIKRKKIEHDIHPLLDDLKKFFEKEDDIVFVYFFESYGKGKISPLSDIDIAIYLKENKNFFEKK